MNRAEIRQFADEFLREATDKLELLSYDVLVKWPEWPETPDVSLNVPSQLEKYHFGVMKDTQADSSIRITIQRYRRYFLGIGEMTADGFIAYHSGEKRRFTQEDIWEVT